MIIIILLNCNPFKVVYKIKTLIHTRQQEIKICFNFYYLLYRRLVTPLTCFRWWGRSSCGCSGRRSTAPPPPPARPSTGPFSTPTSGTWEGIMEIGCVNFRQEWEGHEILHFFHFSLCASVIAAFSISALLEERNKFVMEHIQGGSPGLPDIMHDLQSFEL